MTDNQKKKIKQKSKPVKKAAMVSEKSVVLAERLKLLLKKKEMTFNELAEKLEITPTGLYLSFKRGKITIIMLERIASILNVQPFYFFEAEILERLSDSAVIHEKNPDFKSTILSITRDVSKGTPLSDAIWKVQDPDGYNMGLLI